MGCFSHFSESASKVDDCLMSCVNTCAAVSIELSSIPYYPWSEIVPYDNGRNFQLSNHSPSQVMGATRIIHNLKSLKSCLLTIFSIALGLTHCSIIDQRKEGSWVNHLGSQDDDWACFQMLATTPHCSSRRYFRIIVVIFWYFLWCYSFIKFITLILFIQRI